VTAAVGGVGAAPLRVAHILLLVAWLGVDVGVFYASVHLRAPGLSPETRLAIMRIMTGLDRGARISLVLLVPVSVGLARVDGLGLTGVSGTTMTWLFWLLVAAALAWVYAFLAAQAAEASGAMGRGYRRWQTVNWTVHVVVMLVFGLTGALSLVGVHHYWADYIAIKAVLFAVLVALGLWINVSLRDIGPAFANLLDGETPKTLAAFDAAIRVGYVPVLLIYSGLVAIVVISVVNA
jgi:hypothetical protein